MFLITNTRVVAGTDPLEWNVSFISGFDRVREEPAVDIYASNFFSTAGSKRSPDYTTVASFLLESRLQVWWRSPSGINVEKSAVISAVLGARTFGE